MSIGKSQLIASFPFLFFAAYFFIKPVPSFNELKSIDVRVVSVKVCKRKKLNCKSKIITSDSNYNEFYFSYAHYPKIIDTVGGPIKLYWDDGFLSKIGFYFLKEVKYKDNFLLLYGKGEKERRENIFLAIVCFFISAVFFFVYK